ncbi:MAG: extracellular solute-binding protein [Dongiaceae bacterium]
MTGRKPASPAMLTLGAARRFSRRTMLKNAAAAGTALAVGPWLVKDAFSSSGELNVFSWSDYMPEEHIKNFTDKTGITINFTGYGSNEDLLAKMQATKGRGFDIVSPTVDRVGQWKPLGLLQPFDMNRVPTSKIVAGLLKGSADLWTWDGGQYHLPWTWGTELLAWRTDKWNRDYADLSYGDLWLPELKGKVMGRAHSMMAGIGLHLDHSGKLPSNRMLDAYKDEANMRRIWEEITKFAIEHKPNLKQFWNDADGQINGFMQNDVVLGQCWDGPPTRLKKENQPVTLAAPVEGAFTWLDGVAIPVGAQNIDQIYAFLDYMYEPEVGGKWANATGYNVVSIGADEYLDEAAKKLFQETYPQDTLDNRLWWWPPAEAWYPEIRNEYVDKFVAA